MACLYCQNGSKTFSRLEPIQELSQTPNFPIHDIVGETLNPYREIYECSECHQYWWIRVKGTGDPRSTYPEYYEQTAELIDDQRLELIRYPSVDHLLRYGGFNYPYSFFTEVLEKIALTEKDSLKQIFLKRTQNLPSSAKLWLRNWFQREFPNEFLDEKTKGFPSEVSLLHTMREGESILVTEWISIDQFVILSILDDTYTLTAFHFIEKRILWSQSVKRPFTEGLSIPYLFYQSGHLCYYQGFQKGSEYDSKLNRPNELLLFDLNGNLKISIPLAFRCYEVLSTEERDVSEYRVVHNFSFTIIDETLYLPHGNQIHIYNLKSKQLIQTLKSPNGDAFSGKTFLTETGIILFHTLKGVFAINNDYEIVFQYSSKFHPVFIDSKLNFYYYYAIVDNIQTGEQKRFSKKHDSGIKLPFEIASPPLEFKNRILIPFVWDKSYLLDDKLNIMKELDFTCTDTLGPHSFAVTKSPILIVEDKLVFTNDFHSIQMIDEMGNEIIHFPIQSEVIKLFSFDGKHTVITLSCFDEYSEENQIELILLAENGEQLLRKIFPGPEGLSVNFDGFLIFMQQNLIYSYDLFQEIERIKNPK